MTFAHNNGPVFYSDNMRNFKDKWDMLFYIESSQNWNPFQ